MPRPRAAGATSLRWLLTELPPAHDERDDIDDTPRAVVRPVAEPALRPTVLLTEAAVALRACSPDSDAGRCCSGRGCTAEVRPLALALRTSVLPRLRVTGAGEGTRCGGPMEVPLRPPPYTVAAAAPEDAADKLRGRAAPWPRGAAACVLDTERVAEEDRTLPAVPLGARGVHDGDVGRDGSTGPSPAPRSLLLRERLSAAVARAATAAAR